MKMSLKIARVLLLFALFSACKKEEKSNNTGNVIFQFSHVVNASALLTDSLLYTNEAGNRYEINDVKYFISNVVFYSKNAGQVSLTDLSGVHYVDISMPATLSWQFPLVLPAGQYDSLSFIFGLNADLNRSHAFVNPPEVIMAWPEVLGGGYHYIMMNGKWLDTAGVLSPFNFHLGMGQIYSGVTHNPDSIISFVPNFFRVHLPSSEFTVSKGQNDTIHIIMNIDSWFKTPHTWDFNYWGGMMMQNQDAMNAAKENGRDVFGIKW